MGKEQYEFEITQPGRRRIRMTSNDDGDVFDVEVVRDTGTRMLGFVTWEDSIGADGAWCGYVDAVAFMPNGNEPARVIAASVPAYLFNGDPETREPRLIVTATRDNPVTAAWGIASWCIGGQAPALGYIPHLWPIRGRGLRGVASIIANWTRRLRG